MRPQPALPAQAELEISYFVDLDELEPAIRIVRAGDRLKSEPEVVQACLWTLDGSQAEEQLRTAVASLRRAAEEDTRSIRERPLERPDSGESSPGLINRGVGPCRILLYIRGMACELSCPRAVETAFRQLPGLVAVVIEYETDTALVTYEPGLLTAQQLADGLGRLTGGRYHAFLQEP